MCMKHPNWFPVRAKMAKPNDERGSLSLPLDQQVGSFLSNTNLPEIYSNLFVRTWVTIYRDSANKFVSSICCGMRTRKQCWCVAHHVRLGVVSEVPSTPSLDV